MVVKHNRRSTSARPLRSVGIRWEDMILRGVEDPRNCADRWNLGQSEWDHKLGKIECVLSLYDKMRWKWDNVYLLQGLPNIYSPWLCPPLLPLFLSPYTPRHSLKMYFEAVIERVWRSTWRLRSSELRDALGGRDRASFEMHLEAMLSELRDALGSTWRQLIWRRLIWRRSIWRYSIWRRWIWRR